MTNKTTSDTAQQLQLLSEDTPAIAHELNELFRRYSNQRKSGSSHRAAAPSHRAAAPKERPSTRNDSALVALTALPAPVRFTRKAKPVASESKALSSVSDSSSVFPGQSLQSCKTFATELDGAYDALLWKLMHFDCEDCCQMEFSEICESG
jgi:hypothetical protein